MIKGQFSRENTHSFMKKMPSFKITDERLLCFFFHNIEDANVFKKVHKSSSIAGTVWDKRRYLKKIKLQIKNQGNIFHHVRKILWDPVEKLEKNKDSNKGTVEKELPANVFIIKPFFFLFFKNKALIHSPLENQDNVFLKMHDMLVSDQLDDSCAAQHWR